MHSAEPWRVRAVVFETLAAEGRAPSIAEIARRMGGSPAAVRDALTHLAETHALVLTPDGDAIRMAHPFSAAPMGFVVTPVDGHDDRLWWGGCAWDSFGISAAVHAEVRIDTTCPHCAIHLSYLAGATTPPPAALAVRFPRPATQWWDDVVETCGMIRTFCTREHAEPWAARSGCEGGYIASASTVWELAAAWYGDRLDPDFQPHDRETNQEILRRVGLTGSFWQLP